MVWFGPSNADCNCCKKDCTDCLIPNGNPFPNDFDFPWTAISVSGLTNGSCTTGACGNMNGIYPAPTYGGGVLEPICRVYDADDSTFGNFESCDDPVGPGSVVVGAAATFSQYTTSINLSWEPDKKNGGYTITVWLNIVYTRGFQTDCTIHGAKFVKSATDCDDFPGVMTFDESRTNYCSYYGLRDHPLLGDFCGADSATVEIL